MPPRRRSRLSARYDDYDDYDDYDYDARGDAREESDD